MSGGKREFHRVRARIVGARACRTLYLGGTMSDFVATLSQGLAGRYLVEQEIGSGGMAIVFRARDLRHERWVALKVLRPELASSLGGERFLREIRLAARLQHPHILPVHDSGEARGFLFYVMPFVEGESLRERLKREGQIPLEDALRITAEVADALQYAHQRDVVHRDIKPANIMLSGEHALVADFGIARAIGAGAESAGMTLTETGLAVGTPAYMPPEQASADSRVDGRADIYALGCVLYEMLTGEQLFRGPSHIVMAQHSAAPAPSVRALRPSVPVSVDVAIGKALAKSPADRFTTAEQFASALSGPQSTAMRGASSRRRNFAVAGALFATFAALIIWLARGSESSAEPGLTTIAVAPIRNQGDTSDAAFADGLTQELTAALTRVERIAPRPYSTVMIAAAKEKDPLMLGRQLGVEYVLQSTLRRSHNQLRLLTELIRVKDGTNAWSPRSFQGYDSDLFQMQDSIAKQLTRELSGSLATRLGGTARTYTPDPEAYKLFLRASNAPLASRQSIELYKSAVERDPKFADGWAALANAYSYWAQSSGEPPGNVLAQQIEAINRALSLDGLNGQAWLARAGVSFSNEWDYDRADREYRRAIELTPTSAWAHIEYAKFLQGLERRDAAEAELQRALRLDPSNSHFLMIEGYFRQASGRLAEADSVLTQALAVDPQNWVAHIILAATALKVGKPSGAVAHMEAAYRMHGLDDPFTLCQLAHVYGQAGENEKARAAVARLSAMSKDRYVQRAALAIALLGVRDTDGVLENLEASAALREIDFPLAMQEGAQTLWNHPRFKQLLRRSKLDKYWSAPPRI
jgi:serine/threonine-protein kinase